MKILITGAEGQLAKCVQAANTKHDLILLSKSDLNVENEAEVFDTCIKYQPDIIFHFASLTKGDVCAANPGKAYDVNVNGTKNIVFACVKNDIPLLLVSTNEVFDGEKGKNYTESDSPNPKTIAGKTKYLSEELVRLYLKKYFIVRTMWLYSEWSDNFVQSIIRIARTKESIDLTEDEIGSPTNSLDLAKAIYELINTKRYGTYHIANMGSVSRLEFGRFVLNKLNLLTKVKVHPVPLSSFRRLSKPPLYSSLECKKINSIGISLRTWKAALGDFLDQHKL